MSAWNQLNRRGAAAIGMILILVLVEMIIVGTVLAGTRDHDLRVLRYDTMKSQYAADSVVSMAMRELFRAADDDGDGAIGSIAGGVVANGPMVNGAHAAVSRTVSGSQYTLSAKGSTGSCVRAMSIVAQAATTAMNPLATYANNSAPGTPLVKEFAAGDWGPAATTSALGGYVAWQVLRNSPGGIASPTRGLVTLAQDGSLWISRYTGGAWGAAASLTSAAGTANTRVYTAEYEAKTGNLMVAYRKASDTTIYYRTYTSGTPSEQSASLGLSSAPNWMELAAKPSGNDLVLVVAAGGRLYAGVWDGTSWGNSTMLETALPTAGRPFHVAYMNQSGTAMVVWTATTGAPKCATWNGSAWSGSSGVPAIAGGVPCGWVRLAGSPSKTSDEVLLACIGTNNQINVNHWTGSAWGTNLVVETAAAANTEARVDTCFQPDGGPGLVVWHKSGNNSLLYRTWTGSVWSAQQTGPDLTSEARSIRLDVGYNSNEIMLLARREGPADYRAFNVFSQNGTVTTGSTVISGPTGSGGGILLPTPPSGTAGGTNLSPTDGTIIAPGAYGTLAMTNNLTVGFRAGTYIFSTWTVGSSNTYTFDTSGGPIHVIITAGGITGPNNTTFTNTGPAAVEIDVVNGNVTLSNNTAFTNIDLFVFNGTATFNNGTSGTVNVYASGSVSFKNNNGISPNPVTLGVPSPLSAVLWTAGVPGGRTDIATGLVPAGLTDPCSLAGSPAPSSPTLESWASVSPTDGG